MYASFSETILYILSPCLILYSMIFLPTYLVEKNVGNGDFEWNGSFTCALPHFTPSYTWMLRHDRFLNNATSFQVRFKVLKIKETDGSLF